MAREHSNLYLDSVLRFRAINARNRHKLPHVLVFWFTLEIKSDQVFLVRKHISARHPETTVSNSDVDVRYCIQLPLTSDAPCLLDILLRQQDSRGS